MIDDPTPETQSPCAPAAGASGCPRSAGDAGPNVFQARQLQDNLLVFSDIPVDAPGVDGIRILRIGNVRANVARLVAEQKTHEVRLSLQVLVGGRPITVENNDVLVAQAAPALKFAVRTAYDGEVSATDPVFTVTPGMIPVSTPAAGPVLNVKFSERFPSAFRRRNIATTGSDPTFVSSQSRPGIDYFTESGLFNPMLVSRTVLERAGLADSGTRLRVALKDIPKNVTLWASVRDVPAGTSGYSAASPKALLIDAGPNGAGMLTLVRPTAPGLFQVPVSEGRAVILWEVVTSNAESLEDISFSLVLTSEGPSPWIGTAWISGTLAPHYEDAFAGEAAPRFTTRLAETRAFAISDVVRTQTISVVSGASYSGVLAPDSVGSIFGVDFSGTSQVARNGLANTIGDTSVDIIDFAGLKRPAMLFSISPTQVNFLVDAATQPGPAVVNVMKGSRLVATGAAQIERVAPALFSANGQGSGAALGELIRIANEADGSTPLATFDETGKQWVSTSIDLGADGDLVYMVLYGTGLRNRSNLQNVKVAIDGAVTPAISLGQSLAIPGLDELTVGPLPASLRGRGAVQIVVDVDRKPSNGVSVHVR